VGFLDKLNAQQREAVLHTEGPLLILAGAGSGKTRVIISRIAYLILHHGVHPRSILAVTFTNKAAGEMRERVRAILAGEGAGGRPSPLVSTFHSFCVRLLRREGEPLAEVRPGFGTNFTIYDAADQLAALKAVYRSLGLDEKFMKARSALSVISAAKNQGRTPADFYREAAGPRQERMAVIFERYQTALREANALDFDDLLLEAVRLLRHSEEVRRRMNERFRYLLVDEYQDTNRPQYELMRLLSGERNNVCVVGDEDQSIYSWRGADINNILDFERDFPGAKVIRLEENYRSTQTILQAAGGVVANNLQRKGKSLWTQGAEGEPIVLCQAPDADEEARFVSRTVARYQRENPGAKIAVLYRTNAQSRLIEEVFRRDGHRYLVVGGVSFYQRAEVKDLLAYLKLSVSPSDSISLLRVINTPARGIGRTTVQQLESYARERGLSLWDAIGRALDETVFGVRAHNALREFQKLITMARQKAGGPPVRETLLWIAEHSGYLRMLDQDGSVEAANRRENIEELFNAAGDADQRGDSVQGFLDNAALIADTDQIEFELPVLLMTFHSAKGLEFDLVVMAGLEEGLAPHSRSIEDNTALEEERRLCYVGMTRARKKLILTCARRRRRYGGGLPEPMVPSRFLSEVPGQLVRHTAAGREPDFAPEWSVDGVDLSLEQHEVRESVEQQISGGSDYGSVEHVARFFEERGLAPPPGLKNVTGRRASQAAGAARAPAAPPRSAPKPRKAAQPRRQNAAAAARRGPFRPGAKVRHAKYGLGTLLRLEGEGDTAKFTVHFQDHGLKKLVAKYANLQPA